MELHNKDIHIVQNIAHHLIYSSLEEDMALKLLDSLTPIQNKMLILVLLQMFKRFDTKC